METLPVEMVERIVQLLTPQDLARCSAVCRKWREIFNQDWMWKPYCDPELEEPLRTIPCVATPAFVTPEAENSTLSPNCCWKMAFMRENHLWQNWRKKKIREYKEENAIESEIKILLGVDFLTDTLVVVWYSKCITIFDVSVMPATFVAKIDTSVKIDGRRIVVGPSVLLFEKDNSIEVFTVDIMNKSLKLKHSTCTEDFNSNLSVTEKHFFLSVDYERAKLIIFDLNTGRMLKEEPYPVKVNQNENVKFLNITSSPTSDFVAVAFIFDINSNNKHFEYYIYSLKQLIFLPGPAYRSISWATSSFALHDHWMAVTDCKILKVYNFLTGEVLLSHDVSRYNLEIGSTLWNNSFIFFGCEIEKSWVKSYLPLDGTWATLYESSDAIDIEMINNKFIAIFDYDRRASKCELILSGQTVKKFDMLTVRRGCKVNQSFTRVLNEDFLQTSWSVSYLW